MSFRCRPSSLLSGVCVSSNVDSKHFCFGPMCRFNKCKSVDIELRVDPLDFDRMASGRKLNQGLITRVKWRVTFENPYMTAN